MASLAPRPTLARALFEPLRGPTLIATGAVIWMLGAAYCHGYYQLLTGNAADWTGSLTWSAIAVVPWFALFEWSKQPQAQEPTRQPATLLALVIGIAALSVALEYAANYCLGEVTDRFGLLVMRRLPAIGASVVLIALTRKAVRRHSSTPAAVELGALAAAIDWVEAADNYIQLHCGGKVDLRRMTMREAASSLQPHGFVRIHRRYLVNRTRIAQVGERVIRLTSGEELPIGSAFAANLRQG